MFENLPYRPCVGVMLLNRAGLVFIGRRPTAPSTSIRRMPGRCRKAASTPAKTLDAALRELLEETNVTTVSLLAASPDWYSYDVPGGMIKKSGKAQFKGQRQKWFALRFEGDESEINVEEPGGGAHPEFDAWRWEPMEQLPGLVVPFKRPVYEQVVTAFRPLIETN